MVSTRFSELFGIRVNGVIRYPDYSSNGEDEAINIGVAVWIACGCEVGSSHSDFVVMQILDRTYGKEGTGEELEKRKEGLVVAKEATECT